MYKTIKRYPDYEISEHGDIRRKGSDILRKSYRVNGRDKVILTHNGKTEYISRLVAETYIPNPQEKTDVKHLDGDKSNNHISNLGWADHSETQKDSYGLGVNAPGGHNPPKKVRIVETGEEFPSIRSCARFIEGTPSGIRQCLNGKLYSYKGFHFEIIA